MSDSSDVEIWNSLKEATKEIQSQEKKHNIRRNIFFNEEDEKNQDPSTMKSLEAKNNELEDELLILKDDNHTTNSINKELILFLDKLHGKIRELNGLIYESMRDQVHQGFDIDQEMHKNLPKIKEFKETVDKDMNYLKGAIERHKIRKSKPENKKDNHNLNSPTSFDFDGDDNEIFGESFVIDSNNKELEEKL